MSIGCCYLTCVSRRAVQVGKTGKYINCKTCNSFDLVKVPWCSSYKQFFTWIVTETYWILTLIGLGGSYCLIGESFYEQSLSAWTCSLNYWISPLLSFACPQGYSVPLYHTVISCTITMFPSCIPTAGFISKLFIITQRSLTKASHVWPQENSLKISSSKLPLAS